MNQLSFDDLFDAEKELVICHLTAGYHWIRITSGHAPSEIADRAHFSLHGYDYFYEETQGKDEILGLFEGPIKTVSWEEGIGYGKGPETEQSNEKFANANAAG